MSMAGESQGHDNKLVRKMALAALKSTDMFKKCSSKLLKRLTKKFAFINFRTGEYVIKQGDVGMRFYVILDGTIGVYVNTGTRRDSRVATLKRGACFGERSLISDQKTNASCVAIMETTCVYVTRHQFEQIFKKEDLKMFTENIKMQTLLSSGNTKDISKMDINLQHRVMSRVNKLGARLMRNNARHKEKVAARKRTLWTWWGKLLNHCKTDIALKTKCFRSLDRNYVKKIISKCKIKRYKKKQFIYRKGDVANFVYVVIGGSISVRGTIIKKNRLINAPIRTVWKMETFGEYEVIERIIQEQESLKSDAHITHGGVRQTNSTRAPLRRYYSARAGNDGAYCFVLDTQICQEIFGVYKKCLRIDWDNISSLINASLHSRLGAKIILARKHFKIFKNMTNNEAAVILDGDLSSIKIYHPAETIAVKGKICESLHVILSGEAVISNIPPPLRALTATDKAHGKLSLNAESVNRRLVSNVAIIGINSAFGVGEVLKVREAEIRRLQKFPESSIKIKEKQWRSKSYMQYKNGLVAGSCTVAIMEIDQTLALGHCSLGTLLTLRQDYLTRVAHRNLFQHAAPDKHSKNKAIYFPPFPGIHSKVKINNEILTAHNTSRGNQSFGNYLDMLTSSLVRQAPPKAMKTFQNIKVSSKEHTFRKPQQVTKDFESVLKRTVSIRNIRENTHLFNGGSSKKRVKTYPKRRNRRLVASVRHNEAAQKKFSPKLVVPQTLSSSWERFNSSSKRLNAKLPPMLLTGSFENQLQIDESRAPHCGNAQVGFTKSQDAEKPETPFVIEYFKL
eukprot:g5772.t1